MWRLIHMPVIHRIAGLCGDETRRHVYDDVPQIDVVFLIRDLGDAIYATLDLDSHAVDE